MKNPIHPIIPFDHEVFGTIRSAHHEGEPWFFAVDVCKALGLTNTSASVAAHVFPEDQVSLKLGLRGSAPKMVNEAGLYGLIFGSSKSEAKAFKRWVFDVVLPAIRRDGAYIRGEERLLEEASLEELQARIAELQAKAAKAVEVKVVRAGLCHAEEKEARYQALRFMGRSRGGGTARKAPQAHPATTAQTADKAPR